MWTGVTSYDFNALCSVIHQVNLMYDAEVNILSR